MSAAYLATPKVRHLAVWTADFDRRGFGGFRPICGLPRPKRSLPIWADFDIDLYSPDWRRRVEAGLRRPICKCCAKSLHSLLGLAEVAW
ncbi:MAG: hypothetical protein ACTHQ3_15970 [Motilibacteraceae bacterium]